MAIHFSANGSKDFHCGGVLINKDYVLTGNRTVIKWLNCF